jgi:acetyl esterase/lipase
MRIVLAAACLLALTLCTACRPPAVISEYDIVYGIADEQPLLLDLYRPAAPAATPRPAVVFVHGGGWAAGDKRDFGVGAQALARQGYVALSVNYRLASRGRNPWPAQLDDVQRAVRWLRANAQTYNIAPRRIGAVGHSAGGHLVACLATRETRDNADPALAVCSSRVTCAIDLSGPVDLVTSDNPQADGIIANLLGATNHARPDLARDASPILFVDAKTAPVFIVHGRRDDLVDVRHAEQFAAALRKAGVETRILLFDEEGHGLSKPANADRMIRESLAFLKAHLSRPSVVSMHNHEHSERTENPHQSPPHPQPNPPGASRLAPAGDGVVSYGHENGIREAEGKAP